MCLTPLEPPCYDHLEHRCPNRCLRYLVFEFRLQCLAVRLLPEGMDYGVSSLQTLDQFLWGLVPGGGGRWDVSVLTRTSRPVEVPGAVTRGAVGPLVTDTGSVTGRKQTSPVPFLTHPPTHPRYPSVPWGCSGRFGRWVSQYRPYKLRVVSLRSLISDRNGVEMSTPLSESPYFTDRDPVFPLLSVLPHFSGTRLCLPLFVYFDLLM